MGEWWTGLRRRLLALFRRADLERDIRDEMTFHLAMREAQLRSAGAAQPARQARRRFGSGSRVVEELRDAWAIAPRIGSLWRDVRYTVRTLRRSASFTVVVVATLGLGIGVNTAAFSIVNAALIRPLGFSEPDRLIAIHETLAGFDFAGGPVSPPDFIDLQQAQRTLIGLAAFVGEAVELSGDGPPVHVQALKASASLFPVLGVKPHLGRTFTADEDRPGAFVVVLGWGLWQTRYAGDPDIVGRVIPIDRQPYTVIGVMPAGFEFPLRGLPPSGTPAALWVPVAFADAQRQARGNEFRYGAIGRLANGASLEQARADLKAIGERIDAAYPAGLKAAGFRVGFSGVSLNDAVSGRVGRPLLLLMAAVGLVLLVTCANVANLVLSRAASRTREIAVRTALGSSRGRLTQLLLTEASLLALAGGLAGLVLSRLLVAAIPASVLDVIPATRGLEVDGRVLAFTAAIAMATAVLFAMVPMLSMRSDPAAPLQEDAIRATAGLRRHRLQAGLVVSTVMFAVILLVTAGLFVRSFSALMATELGFVSEQVLTASATLPRAGYQTAASVRGFHDRLIARATALPGVNLAAVTTDLPLETYERRTLAVEGDTGGDVPRNTNLSWVRGAFFDTLGIPLVKGRGFSATEDSDPRWVVVVNERFARAFWPGQDPIGKRLRWGLDVPQNSNRWLTVVGVAGDVADGPPGSEPYLHAYEPFVQFPVFVLDNVPIRFGRHVKLAVRTTTDPSALAPLLRTEIARLDPQLAVESIATMDARLGDVVAPRRFSALVLTGFAAGALVLAAIGLYGLLVFHISERRREIAVRLALGAAPRAIVRMVILRGAGLTALGLVAGVAVSFAVTRAIGSLLYQTAWYDALTFGAAPVVLAVTALVASARPAWRASRMEPLNALRAE
jgi:predicted permease